MSLQTLLNTAYKYHPKADLDMVRLAYDYAAHAHKGQKRLNGQDYIVHPLATAEILAEMKLNIPIIIAALLHDVPEETNYSLADIKKNFGKDIFSMVEGVTKLGKIKYRGLERYIENLRKMFLAMAEDVRVIFIKFADRIHNLETLSALPPKKQYRIALESLEIYAPIANRLGIEEMRGRIEDLAFRYVYPKEYEWTNNLVKGQYKIKKKYVEQLIGEVKKELEAVSVRPLSVYGRAKHFYSLYKKLLQKDRDIKRVYDLVALRIIVKDISDCYAVLGAIHGRWPPMKGRIKDYIAQPKPNGYSSLHTTVFCDNGEIVEFQIRTEEMHEEAEYGIAAHWRYDEAGKHSVASRSFFGEKTHQNLSWIKELIKIQKEVEDKKQYLESLEALKIDIFQSRIFVFTPKGDVIDLPEEATPIDFAYAIHSEVGDKCIGSLVNDQIEPLDIPLKSGDVVLIITDKNRKAPNPDWLNFVKTRQARNKIKAKLKITKLTQIYE